MKQLITSLPLVYVKPGEFHFSRHPELIVTILGSCLAIIMYDIERGICAISHSVLPEKSTYARDPDKNDYKYVDSSIHSMLKIFEDHKIPKSRIMVKVFGGSEQLHNNKRKQDSIGKQNIIIAMNLLKKINLNTVSMDVGGTKGRKIYLSSHTGEVLLSRLSSIKIVSLDKLKVPGRKV
ncbi:MAG: chemotaxis protein CheD [Ignavibacteriaceae bacterium]